MKTPGTTLSPASTKKAISTLATIAKYGLLKVNDKQKLATLEEIVGLPDPERLGIFEQVFRTNALLSLQATAITTTQKKELIPKILQELSNLFQNYKSYSKTNDMDRYKGDWGPGYLLRQIGVTRQDFIFMTTENTLKNKSNLCTIGTTFSECLQIGIDETILESSEQIEEHIEHSYELLRGFHYINKPLLKKHKKDFLNLARKAFGIAE